mmetsp:Transcript_3173/g.7960  ORF Transcript_3173/g.7960 Transcript_3173/m.7960 type:complete len:352 (-) Transcript_3173:224-1279(-)
MRTSAAGGLMAVATLLLLGASPAVGQVYTMGEGAPVVLLVSELGADERAMVDYFAEEQGGAVGMVVTEAIPDPAGNLTAQLLAAMADNGLEAATPPVVGFGDAARHAMLLSYEAWPVTVAVTPDLNPATAPLPERNSSVAEADAAPILLVISDIETNGAFVTDTEESLDAAGIHWETVRYGGTAPDFYLPSASGASDVWERAFGVINSFLDDAEMGGTPGTMDPGSAVPQNITIVSPYMYMDGDVQLEGYLAYPSDLNASEVATPLVVVLPDWDGLNEYEFKRVCMLAEMGYVAVGADVYGLPIGTAVEDRGERIARLTGYRGDAPKYVQRIRAAVDAAKALPYVDGTAWG